MPGLRTPREAWIDAALRTLARGGVDAVRVEKLARELGVTKGGFYGFFADRASLLSDALDRWEEFLVDEPMAAVDAEPGDARARLRRLFAIAAETGSELISIELAIRDWARRDADVAKRVARVDTRRIAFMRELFIALCADRRDAEARCLLAATFFIGIQGVVGDHGDLPRGEVIAAALDHLLR